MATSIRQLLRNQAQLHPKNHAIFSRHESITFECLEAAINRLAEILWRNDLQAGDIVPVLSSRCIETIIAFLAILHVGACYVPMDIESWSRQRIATTVDELSSKVLITTECTAWPSHKVISREMIRACISSVSEFPSVPLHENDKSLAYIIFTSGTTGTPKGVMISAGSLCHYVQQGGDETPFNLGVRPRDKVLLMLSIAFDAFTCITFSTLCNGGTVYLSNPATFTLDAQECTILPITPSLLKLLSDPDLYGSVRSIFLGGESMSPELVHKWFNSRRKLFNSYGATETTCTTLMTELLPNHQVTLGRPIDGSQVLLLDDNLEPCDEGEIVVAGPGLAVGYYKNDLATNEKFILWRDRRIYRTGDYGKCTEDGLEFVGRKDNIVKNRGFLINLEAQVIPMLRSYQGINDAIAFMHRDSLSAFVTPATVDTNHLRKHFQTFSDSFLVPDRIRAVDEFPLTANGKVNTVLMKKRLEEELAVSIFPVFDEKPDILKHAIAAALSIPLSDVNTQESFWGLGGNSFSAIRLLSQLRSHGLDISLNDLYASPNLHIMCQKTQKVEALDSMQNGQRNLGVLNGATQAPDQDRLVPTPQQMHMIRSSINDHMKSHILATIDIELSDEQVTSVQLESAWRQVICRHSIFNCVFDMQSQEPLVPCERVMEWRCFQVDAQDLERTTESVSQDMLHSTKKSDTGTLFYPKNSFSLIEVPNISLRLLWLVHHSLVDGWSINTVFEELEVILKGTELPKAIQFDMYLRERLVFLDWTKIRSDQFWLHALEGFIPAQKLQLPLSIIPQQAGMMPSEQRLSLNLTHEDLDSLSRSLSISAATLIYASWAVLLSEYMSTDRVIFGTVLSGRTFPMVGVEGIVGPLINTCPFPLLVPFLGNANTFLSHVQEQLLNISLHQWTVANGLDMISTASGQLYNTLIAIEYDLPGTMHSNTFNGLPFHVSRHDFPEFDLVSYVENERDTLIFRMVYDPQIFEDTVIRQMMKHFSNILHAFIQDNSASINNIRTNMLAQFLPLERLPTPDISLEPTDLKSAFEKAVDTWPNLTAIELSAASLSYSMLESRANVVANSLILMAKPGQNVAVMSDGSIDWVVAVIAIVKAAAVYTPMDSKLPQQRIEYMLKQSKSPVCILPNAHCERLFRGIKFPCMFLSKTLKGSSSNQRPTTVIQSTEPAYTIFTSGSTGRPKPVQVTHGAVMSYLANPIARLSARPGRKHAQMYSVGFDVSIAELFGTICYGATLLLKEEDPFAHLSRAHAAMATPSFVAAIRPEDYKNLDTLLLAGEPVPQSLSDRWSKQLRLYNGYGPCECTIICLLGELRPQKQVTLGRALPRTNVYILNSQRLHVPVGVVGEICVSGIQVANGYFELDEPGNVRFIENPFVPGERMYCTGDMGSWTEDGEVLFRGRRDNQTKVRGFRVELEEVENAILTVSPQSTQAAAAVIDQKIFGIVSPATNNAASIRQKLLSILPYYAIPSRIITIDSLPMNANQKLDRAGLTDVIKTNIEKHTQSSSKTLKTATEQLLSHIWLEALKLPKESELDPESDFLLSGGHSLTQIQLARRLSEKLGVKVPLKLVLQNTILSDMAKAIDSQVQTNSKTSGTNSFLSYQPIGLEKTTVSKLEEEIFRLSSSSTVPSAFNIVVKLELVGKLDLDQLQIAVDNVLGTHEIFRTIYCIGDLSITRKILPDAPKTIRLQPGNRFDENLSIELENPFEISKDSPVASFIVEDVESSWLVLKLHHIIVDKTSIQVLLQQISLEYTKANLETINSYQTNAKSLVYADWAVWEKSNVVPAHPDDIGYWEKVLRDLPKLPLTGRQCNYVPVPGSHTSFTWDRPKNFSGSLEHYLAATVMGIYFATGNNDIIIAVSHENRSEPGTSEMIGLFLDRIPIRIQLSGQMLAQPQTMLDCIRSTVIDALSHALPFSQIKGLAHSDCLFDVMMTYYREGDSIEQSVQIPEVQVKEHPVRMAAARFPLLVEISETNDNMRCHFEFCNEINELLICEIKKGMLEFLRNVGNLNMLINGSS